jgi:hypothetical protein
MVNLEIGSGGLECDLERVGREKKRWEMRKIMKKGRKCEEGKEVKEKRIWELRRCSD